MVAGGTCPGYMLGRLVAWLEFKSRPATTTCPYFPSSASQPGSQVTFLWIHPISDFLNWPLYGRYLSKSGVVSARNIARSMGDRMVMFLSAPGLVILTEI